MSVRKREWTTRKGELKQAWIVDYTDQHGKRHIETFQRKKDADAHEAKVLIDIGKGVHVAPGDSITVAEAADQWLKRVEANGREAGTLQLYEQHVRTYIAPRLGRIKLAKLTPAMVEGFRDGLLQEVERRNRVDSEPEPAMPRSRGWLPTGKRPLSRATARKVLVSFKSLLKVAKYGHLAADVSIATGNRHHRLEAGVDFPTTDEVKRLVAATTTPRQRALLLTAALTGLRASELRGLRWSDVDLERAQELHVRQRADRFNSIGRPKSRAGTRTVPLAAPVVAALREWKIGCPNSAGGLVFPTDKGMIERYSSLYREFEAVMRAAHVVVRDSGKPKYGLHSFRHFFASWCINPKERGGRELPAKLVQDLLGHSSIVMTLDRYGHLFPRGNDRAELTAAVDRLLG